LTSKQQLLEVEFMDLFLVYELDLYAEGVNLTSKQQLQALNPKRYTARRPFS
jgi:hypothetical protein